jgi:hypothetical protein
LYRTEERPERPEIGEVEAARGENAARSRVRVRFFLSSSPVLSPDTWRQSALSPLPALCLPRTRFAPTLRIHGSLAMADKWKVAARLRP